VTRLRRTHLGDPGIVRRRIGRGFSYRWANGERVTDDETLGRIAALAIPPAWIEVWICPWQNGHIQAVGTDAAGRRQYRYHDEWRLRQDEAKFERMTEFVRALPAMRAAVATELAGEGLTRERVLACAVRLLDIGMFRVGGEEYADQHQTYGLATLQKCHVVIAGATAIFDYPAKGGKERKLLVDDTDVVRVVAQLKRRRGGGEELLAWRNGSEWVDVRSGDINAYIKAHCDGPFSAKDFRTWGATLHAAVALAQLPSLTRSEAALRRAIAAVVRDVSEVLGNTPAVCRNSYIDPRVIDRFADGEVVTYAFDTPPGEPFVRDPATLCALEQAVIELVDASRSPATSARAA
jgi:DNA topoisomerase IB